MYDLYYGVPRFVLILKNDRYPRWQQAQIEAILFLTGSASSIIIARPIPIASTAPSSTFVSLP